MGTPGVVFGDVNWNEERFGSAFGTDFPIGDEGWPTIRFFNKGTGYGGRAYKKKTDQSLDAELGDEDRFRDFVSEKSGISNCDVVWGTDCSSMELKYIDKWIGPDVGRN